MALLGILNVNKPAGCTSRDVVSRVAHLARPAKCGHAGTLDPLATGVLVVGVGQATRLTQYVQRMAKRYRATFLLGRRSATDDIEGQIEQLPDAPQPALDELQATLPQFLGDIQQRPPAHSAVKIAGRRAYKLARAGQEIELAERIVTIHDLAIRRYEYPELELDIHCGSGTYVRALGRDLATALGTAAVMSALVRTAVGQFRVEEAVAFDALTSETLRAQLRSALVAVAELPSVALSDEELVEIRHGRPIPVRGEAAVGPEAEWAAVDSTGQLVAILCEKHPGQLWPLRNLRT